MLWHTLVVEERGEDRVLMIVVFLKHRDLSRVGVRQMQRKRKLSVETMSSDPATSEAKPRPQREAGPLRDRQLIENPATHPLAP